MNRYLFLFLYFFLATMIMFSQVPRTISFQGILTDEEDNAKPDGTYSITFSFYESENDGNAVWTENKTLTLSKGLFSTSLGDQVPFSTTLRFDKQYWLGIKVGDEAELTPRIALTSAGYSLTSSTTLGVENGIALKSLNGLKDDVTLEGSGGTTINTNGNKITISSSGSGGTGIQGVQNTNNTIDITNPNGPTATVNVKVPLAISGSGEYYTLRGYNTGNGGGVWGETWNQNGSGVVGYAPSGGWGVYGNSPNGSGVVGTSSGWLGVYGESNSYTGVEGRSKTGTGTAGVSESWVGVYGQSDENSGVWGKSKNGTGVFGESTLATGVYGITEADGHSSVIGRNSHPFAGAGTYGALGFFGDLDDWYDKTIGVLGISDYGNYAVVGLQNSYGTLGVLGFGNVGVYGRGTASYFAGYFDEDVNVTGTLYAGEIAADDLYVSGNKNFKIDHPLYPQNKYLVHSSVESPERMNIYNGNITTDGNGLAVVELPGYFEALNIEYRYQLTVFGQFAQAIVESEILDNHFTIRTDKPNVKVSWQVTGIRNDEYAKQHPLIVEQEKEEKAKGKYLMPELYREPEEKAINYYKLESNKK